MRYGKAGLLVLGILLSLFVASLGLYFDLLWHQNFPFESFWTPAHGVLYGGVMATAALLILTLTVRDWSGVFRGFQSFSLAFLRGYPLPLTLALMGTVTVLVAGALDEQWHSLLGGGESAFSWPHNLALSGGVLLGVSVSSIVLHSREVSRRLALVGWVLWSIAWPIVLFRYLGYLRFSEAEVLEMVSDERLSSDPAWLHIVSNVVKYELTGSNPLLAPLPVFAVATLFLYMAHHTYPLRGEKAPMPLGPATLSALLYASGIIVVNSLLVLAGYRALYTAHILASLLFMGLMADLLGLRRVPEALRWPLSSATASIVYSLMLGYTPYSIIIALAGSLAGGYIGYLAGRTLLGLALKLDPRGIAIVLLVVLILPLTLGTLDSFLRYEEWSFPPRP